MMNAVKRAVSPLRPCRTSATDAGPSSALEVAFLTKFVLNRLQGPSKELFALSFAAHMFEDLLMLADTRQGKEARKMYKQLRNAVQDYMKMEFSTTIVLATV